MLETLKTRKEELEKRGKKGFTLMEMLIVIAIIAILIAIAIPIFTAQLEKANEAKDAANIRSAYAVAAAAVLTDNADACAGPVTLTQTGDWEYITETIGGKASSTWPTSGDVYVTVTKDGTVTIGAQNTAATQYTADGQKKS